MPLIGPLVAYLPTPRRADSTVDLATLGPVGRSAVAVRFFHLATVFWLIP